MPDFTPRDHCLPPPASVEIYHRRARSVSMIPAGVRPSREVDPQLDPLSWDLHYDLSPLEVIDVLRLHCKEHYHQTFLWTAPGESAPRRVLYSSPTQITWLPSSALVQLEAARPRG